MSTTTITITEALSEMKLIDNKIKNKTEFVLQHTWRTKNLVDPLESEGGSPVAISSAMQSINDLQNRKIAIRTAINAVNRDYLIKIGDEERTIEEWLVWKRIVYPSQSDLLRGIANNLVRSRDAIRSGSRLQNNQALTQDDIISHIPEKELMSSIERLQEKYDKLDGLLSLKNAQITIRIED